MRMRPTARGLTRLLIAAAVTTAGLGLLTSQAYADSSNAVLKAGLVSTPAVAPGAASKSDDQLASGQAGQRTDTMAAPLCQPVTRKDGGTLHLWVNNCGNWNGRQVKVKLTSGYDTVCKPLDQNNHAAWAVFTGNYVGLTWC